MTDYAALCGLPDRTPTQTLMWHRDGLTGLLKRCELPQDADTAKRLNARLDECDADLRAMTKP